MIVMKHVENSNRCPWVDLSKPDYVEYHDKEWGVPVHDDKLIFERVLLKNRAGEVTTTFRGDEEILVEIHYTAREKIAHPHFIVGVSGPYGELFTASMTFDGLTPDAVEGAGIIGCRFRPFLLLPATYTIVS